MLENISFASSISLQLLINDQSVEFILFVIASLFACSYFQNLVLYAFSLLVLKVTSAVTVQWSLQNGGRISVTKTTTVL